MFVHCLLCAASSTSQAQLFQCQPSGDNEQVFPNIPDVLFDSTEAANSVTGEGSSLTPLQPNVAYIFTIPGVGDDRNCSGNVIAFEYCYQLGMTMGNRPKFEFLQLTRGSQPQIFTVDSIFGVRDEPICADIEGSSSQQVCCTRSTNQHEAPTTEYTIGIGVSNDGVRPLAFSDSLTEYNSNQIYQTTNNFQQGDEITANLLTGASIPLLRFYLGKQILYTASVLGESELTYSCNVRINSHCLICSSSCGTHSRTRVYIYNTN